MSEHSGTRDRGVAVALDQTQKALPPDKFDLAKLDGGDRDRRWPSSYNRAQPQHLAVPRNFQDDGLAIAGLDRKLGATGTGDVNPARNLTLRQQRGVGGIQ